MPEQAGFNPRYSPEFQRGYRPEAPEQAPEQSPEQSQEHSHERADAATTPPRNPPPGEAAESVPPPAPTHPPAYADAGPDDATYDGHDGEAIEAGAAAADDGSRPVVWRNPYIIALLVVGVLLMAGGLQLYFHSVGWLYLDRSSNPRDLVSLQVAWGLAPVLTTAGVFAVIGVGFFAASRWRRDHAQDRAPHHAVPHRRDGRA